MEYLQNILPLISISIFGFILTKLHFFPKDIHKNLSRYIIFVSAPALSIYGISNITLEELTRFPIFILSNLIVYLLFISLIILFTKRYKIEYGQAGAIIYSSFSGNVIYFGLPILTSILGEKAIPYLFSYLAVVVEISGLIVGYYLVSQKQNKYKISDIVKNVISNPLLIATLIGFAILILKIFYQLYLSNNIDNNITNLINSLSVNINNLLKTTGSTTSIIALLSLGSYLSISRIDLKDLKIPLIGSVIKLYTLPIIVLLIMKYLIQLDEFSLRISVILASMPSALYNIVASEIYEFDKILTLKNIILSTILFILTFSFILNLI